MNRPLALAGLVVALALLGAQVAERGVPGAITNPADFRAFYCASGVLLQRGDPYRTEPLRTCEHEAAETYGLHVLEGLVLPAPLPPFALLALTPLAVLPFTIASPLWFALCLLAVASTVVIVRKLSGARLWVIALAFGIAGAFESLPNGQIVPLVVLATSASALALRAGRYRAAALLALVTLVEPHLGAPLCFALFLWSPPTRRVLGLGVAALAAASLAWCGIPLVREYLGEVLPLHARSEVTQLVVQYSLTALAYALGLSERAALAAGSLSYVAMAVLGLWLARRLARAWRDEALLALTPPALVLFGGVFIHLHQMAAALPLAFVLTRRASAASRLLATAAVLCLTVPWEAVSQLPVVQSRFAAQVPAASLAARRVPPAPAAMLAETAEIAFIASGGYGRDARNAAELVVLKLPTWLGLLALTAAAALALRRPAEELQLPDRAQRRSVASWPI